MKLYVLIRNDLTTSQQAVQGGHVVAKIASKKPNLDWDNQTFIYLKVSKLKLLKYLHKFSQDNKFYEKFCEPDLGNQITSIACFGTCGEFKELNLL